MPRQTRQVEKEVAAPNSTRPYRLDREIKNDQNWGAALIEGAVAVGIAFVGNLYVPAPGAPGEYDVCPIVD